MPCLLVILGLIATACDRTVEPQAVYEDARMKLKRGELRPALEETNKTLQRFPSEKEEWHWRFRVLKAEILMRQGLSSQVLSLLNSELPVSLAGSDLAVRRKLIQAVANALAQQPGDASRLLADGEALAEAKHPELLGEVALRKGSICFLAADMVGAENGYRKALQIAREQKDPFSEAAALSGLGLVATKEQHYDEAIDWNRAALQLSQSVGAHYSLAQVLGNMAWSYRELGDFENALVLDKEAEEASARNGLVKEQIYWLTGISNIYYAQHEYGLAEAVLVQALDLARGQDDKRTLTEFLNDLSEITLETGRIKEAEKYNKEASEIEQAGLDQSGVVQSSLVRGRIDENKRAYTKAEQAFLHVIADSKANAAQKWEAEARLAQAYADEGQYGKADKEFRRSLETIESVRSSVHAEDLRLSFLSSGIGFYDGYIEFLISQGRMQDALQVAELSRARTLAEGLGMAPNTLSFPLRDFRPRQIAHRSKATLLFYWLGWRKSYLWAVTPAKVNFVPLPGAIQIDPLVKSYGDAVLSGRDVLGTANPDGMQLYKILIEPAKKLIPQGSRVILLPDGSLYGLNFDTLLVPEPALHFWIEDVTLSTASSLTLLSAGTRIPSGATVSGGNLLLVGNATQAAPDYPVLRHAETEMVDVKRYFPESRREVLAGLQATPAAFLTSEFKKFAYIHFVTHGIASRTHPLDSAIILSPQGDSYKLYARDIVRHSLSAYLVTVSACNGSGTRAYSGEGLVGLSWAFLRAGAHNVIAALWEVNDASTPQLMDRLYGELSRGKDPASALRAAKLSLLKSDSVVRKPFYWGPFQLYVGS